ncbi:hypothetical protein FQR65_LT06230 [Abscondita terminalis]|nr:hypothetical protein FQR65_LT06230 [Abscondita terminalis]
MGVLWNVGNSIPGVKETLEKFKLCGKKMGFVSNNSLQGAVGIYQRLTGFIDCVEMNDIVLPIHAIISYLKNINFDKEIYIIGSTHMKQEFVKDGLKVSNKEIDVKDDVQHLMRELSQRNENIGAVVFDYDIFVSYLSLVQVVFLLKQKDIIFITGATDKKVPITPNITLPGPQMFVDALLAVVEQTPIEFGKPSLNFSDFIKVKYNIEDASRVLFVGDSIEQDVEFGSISGFQTLLVLTGLSTLADAKNCSNCLQVPEYYIDSLGSFSELVFNKLGI